MAHMDDQWARLWYQVTGEGPLGYLARVRAVVTYPMFKADPGFRKMRRSRRGRTARPAIRRL